MLQKKYLTKDTPAFGILRRNSRKEENSWQKETFQFRRMKEKTVPSSTIKRHHKLDFMKFEGNSIIQILNYELRRPFEYFSEVKIFKRSREKCALN